MGASGAAVLECARDCRKQRAHLKWFLNRAVCPGLSCHLLHIPVCRHQEDRNMPEGFLLFDLSAEIPAVASRQTDIEQQKVGLLCAHHVQHLFPISCGDHVVALHFQHLLEYIKNGGLIISDQYFHGDCASSTHVRSSPTVSALPSPPERTDGRGRVNRKVAPCPSS